MFRLPTVSRSVLRKAATTTNNNNLQQQQQKRFLSIHEYLSMGLLEKYGVKIPRGMGLFIIYIIHYILYC